MRSPFPACSRRADCSTPGRKPRRGSTCSGTAAFRSSSSLMRGTRSGEERRGDAGSPRSGHGGCGVPRCAASRFLRRWAQDLLPPIMQGNHYTPALIVVVSSVWLLNLLAVAGAVAPPAVFGARSLADRGDVRVAVRYRVERGVQRRPLRSRLLCRQDLRPAGGELRARRLAAQNGKLYVQLIRLRESDRDKAAELQRLSTIDPLTGIANRRAFDEALGQEWRRMMRHGHAAVAADDRCRLFQALQRHLRPCRRRSVPARGGAGAGRPGATRRRNGGALRRRGIRGAVAAYRRSRKRASLPS